MKSNLDKHFKTNDTFAKEGIDIAIDDTTSFKVRHFNEQNPKVKAAMALYYKPHARQIDLGTLSPEKSAEITRNIFIDTCLVSWVGVKDDKNQDIECNKENARELFKSLPALLDVLWKNANDFSNYKEDVGNS
jgi:hypothetical protein